MVLLWLNEKHLEEKLDHEKLVVITGKCCLEHRKHRFELVEESKKEPNKICLHEKIALKTIMNCKRTESNNFKRKLRFNLHDVLNTKEQINFRRNRRSM